ncbi:unnamed protein product [Allacma fusca]|uniref:Uncharacterized protein n=1 Tax=Allacma fusca TaxID=39272 RepID=A0A8J2L4X0_9HEXA|nr:unnamed protein product [Allacma fusca]
MGPLGTGKKAELEASQNTSRRLGTENWKAPWNDARHLFQEDILRWRLKSPTCFPVTTIPSGQSECFINFSTSRAL